MAFIMKSITEIGRAHNREMEGKQLFSYDKKYLENAKKLLHSEISFVFNIKIEDAENFIKERLKKS